MEQFRAPLGDQGKIFDTAIQRMRENPGKLVPYLDSTTEEAPPPAPGPRRVVILTDKGVGSAAEGMILLARQSPEGAADLGISGLDEEIFDLKPGFEKREEEDTRQVLAQLEKRLPAETDPPVRQDLQILIDSLKADLKGSELSRSYQIPYFNLTQTIFGSMRSLLDDQVEASRRPAALVRLKKYTGMAPGFTPIATLAETYVRSRLKEPGLVGPFKDRVERDLANNATVLAGIEELFKKYNLAGYEEPYAKLKAQLAAYDDFVRKEILPRARTDFRLPPKLYAFGLEQVGVDMPVEELPWVPDHAVWGLASLPVTLHPDV